MKRLILSALVAGVAFTSVDAQLVAKKPIFEEGTNASCDPCASQNPDFDLDMENNHGDVVVLKYQWYFPGVDPMHSDNPTEATNRVAYYGINGVPTVAINGAIPPDNTGNAYDGAPALVDQTMIDGYLDDSTNVQITLTHTLNLALDSVMITCDITNVGTTDIAAGKMLRVALIEEQINYATAPGTNGETEFNHVMRKMYPDDNGTSMGAITAGSTLSFSFAEALPTYIRDVREVAVVAFVQDDANKEIMQAEVTVPSLPAGAVIADASATSSSTAPTSSCDYNFTPAIDITNEGTQALDSVVVSYSINGGTPVEMTYPNAIAAGATATATFPAATLTGGGTVTVSYTLGDLYAGGNVVPDIAAGNNVIADDTYALFSAAATGSTVQEGFQGGLTLGSSDVPGVIVNNPNSYPIFFMDGTATAFSSANLGGFGNSDGCYVWDFWPQSFQSGEASIMFDKLDLSSTTNPELKFNYAFAQWDGSNDQAQVNISTDCGVTWTNVWDKSGADLATAPDFADNSSRFVPAATEWDSATVDLSAYATSTEVIIEFKGISNWGNPFYLDDVNVDAAAVSTNVEVAQATTEVRIMPNPVSDVMNLEISVSENTEASVEIYNAIGQRVKTVTNTTLVGTNVFTVNTSDLAAGVYNVNIITEQGMTTKRFSVQR